MEVTKMNNNLDLAKKTRKSLEALYNLYSDDSGELIMLDEDSILYKGKEFHHDQYLIFLMNKRISVKINGSIENENLAHNSSVKLSDTIVEKYFDDIEEKSAEYLAIIELNKSINNLLTQKNIKKL